MEFKPGQIAVIKQVRAKLGLGLREAYDLAEKYPNLTADEIVTKLQPAHKAKPGEGYSSNLPVRGWIVSSMLFPALNGYQAVLGPELLEQLQQDKGAVIRELVYKVDADELIGNMQRLAR